MDVMATRSRKLRELALASVASGLMGSLLLLTDSIGPGARFDWLPMLLTALGLVSLWGAGNRQWWAWLLGFGLQGPWLVYCVVSEQLAFVPSCIASAVVQAYSFVRAGGPPFRREGAA
jgi:hypothetical protein